MYRLVLTAMAVLCLPLIPDSALAASSNSPALAREALTKLSGWWRYDSWDWGCDDTDNQYRAAFGAWTSDDTGIHFGKGDLGVGMYDGGCTFSDLHYSPASTVSAERVSVHAQCRFEGEDSAGPADIYIFDKSQIRVMLPGFNAPGMDLIACPVAQQQAAAKEADDWVPVNASGWSIELPANLANGPQQAIIENGRDVGMFLMAEDSSESLMTFAADLGGRPMKYLEARYTGREYAITYRFDREAVAVVSGFMGEGSPQTFYTKCLAGTEGRCFELIYDTKDGSRMAPVVERISQSFKTAAVAPAVAGKHDAFLAELPTVLDEDAIHDLCRYVGESHNPAEEFAPALAGRSVDLRIIAQSYSPQDHLLRGTNYLHAGAYAADVVVDVDVSKVSTDGLHKGGAVRARGTLLEPVFYGNIMDNCFIQVTASSLEAAGF
ncbi:hypothetical protein [Paradevosia shaoguanensis]|uniref:hypothetical protein n=1 Tax=Paradevosia shaoguanensis TaxID=1335043 RepID=UPI003C74D211